jgi:hypothetical protein
MLKQLCPMDDSDAQNVAETNEMESSQMEWNECHVKYQILSAKNRQCQGC